MEESVRKKVNLLVHLARIDGNLDQSEQDMLVQILKEYGEHDYNWNKKNEIDLNNFKGASSRADILFLALQMVRADGIIHPDEVAYCKALAIKLEFNPGIIDHYTKNEIPDLAKFKEEAKAWHR
jgi:tellurite resistance protein